MTDDTVAVHWTCNGATRGQPIGIATITSGADIVPSARTDTTCGIAGTVAVANGVDPSRTYKAALLTVIPFVAHALSGVIAASIDATSARKGAVRTVERRQTAVA